MTMRETFIAETSCLLDTTEHLCVVLADIGSAGFRENGSAQRHPDRVINVGIREQLMIGVAAGLALEGFRPIVHSYAPFVVDRPHEQIKLDFAHQGVGGILVTVGASYDAAAAGRTHQAPDDVALMYTIPGCSVYAPGHPDEVSAILDYEAEQKGLAYMRLSDEENKSPYLEGVGGVTVVQKGSHGCPVVLSVGPSLQAVVDGCSDLDVTILYTATPRPLSARQINDAVTGTDVFIVEPYLEGTSAADISAALSHTPHRLFSIGTKLRENRRYGSPEEHRKAHGLDAGGIRERVLQQSGGVEQA